MRLNDRFTIVSTDALEKRSLNIDGVVFGAKQTPAKRVGYLLKFMIYMNFSRLRSQVWVYTVKAKMLWGVGGCLQYSLPGKNRVFLSARRTGEYGQKRIEKVKMFAAAEIISDGAVIR